MNRLLYENNTTTHEERFADSGFGYENEPAALANLIEHGIQTPRPELLIAETLDMICEHGVSELGRSDHESWPGHEDALNAFYDAARALIKGWQKHDEEVFGRKE